MPTWVLLLLAFVSVTLETRVRSIALGDDWQISGWVSRGWFGPGVGREKSLGHCDSLVSLLCQVVHSGGKQEPHVM